MSKKTQQKAIRRLEAIYATLPRVACRGLCAVSCGPIFFSDLERVRMRKADARRRLPMVDAHATCTYLTDAQRCGVYAVRPLICRVYGTLKRLSCLHGCLPDRWLSDHEFVTIGTAIEALGGPMYQSGIEEKEAGPVRREHAFRDLDLTRLDPATADQFAEMTRTLRAIHGGRIVSVGPSETGTHNWIDLDQEKK